nr:hypothetical protein [Tanacetum cinerariifolium]
MLPIELTNAYIRNFEAYKEYYAVATGTTPPKTKASVRKTKSSFDTTVTPPPTAAAGTRLFSSAKGKQPATTYKAKRDADDDKEEGSDDEQASDEEGKEFIHSSLSTHDEDETRDEESFDPILKTPENMDDEGNGEENLGLNVGRKEGQDEEDDVNELYRDVNINLEGRGIESIFEITSQMDVQAPTTVAPLPVSAPTLTPSTIATITTVQQAQTLPTTAPSTLLQNLPNFCSLFGFDHRLKISEDDFSEFSDRLRDEAQAENDEFLKTIDENMHKIIKKQVKEHVKVQVSKILPKIEQTVNEQLEAELLTQSSNSSKTSYVVAADLSEMELKKILIEKIKGNKSIHQSNEQMNLYKALVEAYESNKIILDTYGDTFTLKRGRDDDADKDEEPSVGSDRGSKKRREGKEPESASAPKEKATRSVGKSTQGSKSRQTSASESATTEEPMQTTHEMEEPSHPEFEIAFLMNRLKVDTLTPELLAGPTYELMKGSCKSLVELEFFLEEVYKATTDQLDWVNPKGQQYPHNLLKPLPLIPNFRGRRVIPFDHFINNDLEYLRGGASTRKYTTFVTNTKAIDYGHIKWIKDLVAQTIIIAVTELKIVESHNYKHLDWITVRRDDDKLYKFKEGDFKRLRIQDIEDMLLLLVQRKLTNLTVEERFAFNVSLRMFTRSIVIQRRMEDLQLGVESYQKKLNLTWPDTHRSDLKRKEAYIAYSNPRGFIYQDKDKLTGIQMKYLPQTIWRKSDKERAIAMIQAIDKQLKTRRIMRSLERYKVVRHRYSNLMIQPEPEGSTQGYPLVSVEVLRYDKRSKSENMGIVLTEMELILEHTQQGISHEVSMSLTEAGNPVKKILLKLNLSDHRSILTDSQMEVRVPVFSCLNDS